MCKFMKPHILVSIFLHPEPRLHAHYSPINSTILLIIRVVAALYLTGFYLYDFSDSETLLNRWIYLTNVGYFLTWLYFLIIVQSRIFSKVLAGLDQFAEVIFQTVFCAEVVITAAYWSILYTTYPDRNFLNNVNWHAVPLFLLLLDFIFCSYRFIPSQFMALIVLVFFYMFWINMPYSLAVRPVYGAATNWVNWMTYVLIVAGVVVGGLAFLLGRAVYLKCKQEKILKNNQADHNNQNKNDIVLENGVEGPNREVNIGNQNQTDPL